MATMTAADVVVTSLVAKSGTTFTAMGEASMVTTDAVMGALSLSGYTVAKVSGMDAVAGAAATDYVFSFTKGTETFNVTVSVTAAANVVKADSLTDEETKAFADIGTTVEAAVHSGAVGSHVFTGTFNGAVSVKELTLSHVITIGHHAFHNLKELTVLNLPEVQTIGRVAFYKSYMTSAIMPKVVTIGLHAFHHASLKTLDIPMATTIGAAAFMGSPLTRLVLSAATSIGDNAFVGIINSATTTVTMKEKFHNEGELDRIFGAGNHGSIAFTWV